MDVERMNQGGSDMNEHQQSTGTEAYRFGSPAPSAAERTRRDEWTHDFRNALGTVLVAAGVARSLLPYARNAEVTTALGRIDEGCNRCLGLLRTMPPL